MATSKNVQNKIVLLQLNLGRSRIAHDLSHALMLEKKADTAIISQPNKKITDNTNWIKDKKNMVAILILNKNCGVQKSIKRNRYIILELQIISCYLAPSMSLEEYKTTVNEIFEELKAHKKEVIILGDINSKSQQWGAPLADTKGEYWADCMAETDVDICNDGTPTFIKGDSASHIDITCATSNILQKVSNWHTLDDEIASYHKPILFSV